MRVTVRFFAVYRDIAGRKEEQIDVGGQASVGALLDMLFRRSPRLRPEIVDGEGNVREYVGVLANGRHVRDLQGLSTPLADGDVLSLFPPVAGGISQMRIEETLRGIPRVTLVEYLVELCGVEDGDLVRGPGWDVSFEVTSDRVGSLDIPVVRLRVEGRARAVRALLDALRPKIVRAGG